MANLKASIRDIKKSEKKRLQNNQYKNKAKKTIRSFNDAVKGKEPKEKLNELLSQTFKILDKSAKVGVFHPNKVARKKSRLSKMIA